MFDLKWIWVFMFGCVLLVLPVTSALGQTEAPASAYTVFLIGEHPGIPESDTRAAAMLVCDALRTHGIAVSDPVYEAPASGSVYRIIFSRLGEKILVRLSHEDPIGTLIRTRQMTLGNIEEMIPAAPRLVEALVHNKSIDATVDMESVTEHEARALNKITGESLWHIGFLGLYVPGTDIVGTPALEFGWSYEAPSYAAGTQFRFRYQEEEDKFEADGDLFSFFSWSIGGRYFLNKQNISPYVGGGLTVIGVDFETKTRVRKRKEWFGLLKEEWEWVDEYNSEGANGLGAYATVGIELFRLTQNRLNLELRVDRPFFRLPSRDVMPITLGVFYSMHYVPGQSGCFLF